MSDVGWQVTERKLVQRINARLRHSGDKMRACPVGKTKRFAQLGRFYVVNGKQVVATHCDLMTWGSMLRALRAYETLIR